MKKIICTLIALTLMACGFAMAETIAPQFDALDTTEGTYVASFDRNDLKDGVLGGVEIYTRDIYDLVDVAQMAVGDTFVAEGREVTIESIDTNQYDEIEINGGYEAENGFTLTTLGENDNGWTTTMDDDYSTYTQRGVYDLELAESVSFEDSWDIDGETVNASGIEDVTSAILESPNDTFVMLNTEIRLEGGKVVEIARWYMP